MKLFLSFWGPGSLDQRPFLCAKGDSTEMLSCVKATLSYLHLQSGKWDVSDWMTSFMGKIFMNLRDRCSFGVCLKVDGFEKVIDKSIVSTSELG